MSDLKPNAARGWSLASAVVAPLAGVDRARPSGALQTPMALLLVAIASTWPVFVFGGSQIAYLIALIASVGVAALLAHARSPWIFVFLTAQFALLGPEASGELAPGEPLVGSLRITDASLLAAVVGLVPVLVSDAHGHRPTGVRPLLEAARGAPIELKIAALIGGWTVALWFAAGAPISPATKADVRWLFVAVGTVWVGLACRPRSRSSFILGLVAIGALAAIKALVIYLTEYWAIGNYDRIQASLLGTPEDPRVILVGGDTFLVLVPAIAALAVSVTPNPRIARALTVGACLAFGAIVVSGTRTNLPIALALGLAAWVLMHPVTGPWLRRPRTIAALIAGTVALAGGAVATGLGERYVTKDAPHVGVNFRADEIRSFTSLPDRDVLLGQGVGGTFTGKDVNGEPVSTGWAHALPVWLALKGGIVALLGALAIGALFATRLWKFRSAEGSVRRDVVLGAALVVGTIALSFTLGRASLPEGVFLIGLGIALVYQPQTE